MPRLIIHGEKDSLQPVSYAKIAHKLIANTQLEILPKVGHMFFNAGAQQLLLSNLLQHFKNG